MPWERVPAGSAPLLPVAGNPRRFDLTRLPGSGRFLLDHVEANPVVIGLECIGVVADGVLQLNEPFSTNHPRAEWDGTVRELRAPNRSFTVRYCISTSETGCAPPPTGPVLSPDPRFIPPIDLMLTLPRPTHFRLDRGTDACDELLTDWEFLACAFTRPFGGVPHLYWDWDGAPIYREEDITGYHVEVIATSVGQQFPLPVHLSNFCFHEPNTSLFSPYASS